MTSQIKSLADAKIIVDALRSAPASVEAHQQARTLCNHESWGYLCEAGYPELIAQYAESWGEADAGPNGLPAWYLSASEFTIAFQASNTTSRFISTGPLNIRALARLRGVLPKLLRAMLATRDVTLVDPNTSPETEKVDACITVASGILFAVSHNLKIHPDEQYIATLRSSGALEVALLCWFHTPHLSTRITSSITLESLLSPSASSSTDSLLRLTSTLPAQSIVTRAKEAIQDGLTPGKMTSGHRLVELCLIQWLVDEGTKNELGVWFVRGDTQSSVMQVVEYELNTSKAEATKNNEEAQGTQGRGTTTNWELIDMAGAVLLALSNIADLPVATLIEYVQRLRVLNTISQIFQNEDLSDEVPAWSNILDLLVHCTTCNASNCHYVRTDAYISALRTSLESGTLWANTLMRLQELVQTKGPDAKKMDARKQRLRLWYGLGKELGLTAHLPLTPPVSNPAHGSDKVQVRRNVDGCWYAQCPQHGSVDEALERSLARCSQCKVARYCATDCQRADWKVHKSECKVLKGP